MGIEVQGSSYFNQVQGQGDLDFAQNYPGISTGLNCAQFQPGANCRGSSNPLTSILGPLIAVSSLLMNLVMRFACIQDRSTDWVNQAQGASDSFSPSQQAGYMNEHTGGAGSRLKEEGSGIWPTLKSLGTTLLEKACGFFLGSSSDSNSGILGRIKNLF